MNDGLIDRIVRESGVEDLIAVLAERLSPTDLQSLLLEVYRRRAARETPARLLEQYEQNRFVRPATVDPRVLLAFDPGLLPRRAPVQPVELSPVCPLGTNSAVATVDQNKAVTTIRNTEVVSDATNVLALECARRRRALLRTDPRAPDHIRLCASHRLLRPQSYGGPGHFAHFRLFCLVTAGRDAGSFGFETETLLEQLDFYLRLLGTAPGFGVRAPRVTLTDLTSGTHQETLRTAVLAPLAARFPEASVEFDPERTTGRGYYEGACFHVTARDTTGAEYLLADGGFTNWTQTLLSNRKERLLISGIGSERLCSLFVNERAPG